MNNFVETATVMGKVTKSVTPQDLATQPWEQLNWFDLRTRSGDDHRIFISTETSFQVLSNLDGLDSDRVPTPEWVGQPGDTSAPQFDWKKLAHRIFKYIAEGNLIVVRGVYQQHESTTPAERFDARTVYLLDSKVGNYLFESDHWWLTQIERLADGWLDVMFGDRRDYGTADFAELYTTQLNILGYPTDDQTQEMATLSRLIYGLSSAYLLTGDERYRRAAAAGAQYQRETFRCLDGETAERCVWASAKRKRTQYTKVAKILFPSQFGDDINQIPLYEQIYALAGLTHYYRISNDPDIFTDIIRTVRAFEYYWRDPVTSGYFSHIDYETFRPDAAFLGQNRLKKNWNSIGDHLPAYLFNLLLALEPTPAGRRNDIGMEELRQTCRRIMADTTDLIRRHFPGNREDIPAEQQSVFVNERFFGDNPRAWQPDHDWGWQKNRGIVGHNLKIAWNLTRAAHFFLTDGQAGQAAWLVELAEKLGRDMAEKGIDQHRGGCFDAVERVPANGGMPYEITWLPTKDFWQQEQAILAYLILFGYTGKGEYLQMAREMEAFWNLFFLDRDRWGIFFRTREDGSPVIEGTYGDKGGHSISGYHSFELNFLAHIYTRVFLPRYHRGPEDPQPGRFCLFFRPSPRLVLVDGETTFNVLPDYFPPGMLTLESIQIGGVIRPPSAGEQAGFYVRLTRDDLDRELVVVFQSHAMVGRARGFEATAAAVPDQSPFQESARRGTLPTEAMRVNVPNWQRPAEGRSRR